MAKLSSILAKSCISIFAVSTFDTDYILVMKQHVDKAVDALKKEKYKVKVVWGSKKLENFIIEMIYMYR